jgi:DNA-binding response OmpR family regulator
MKTKGVILIVDNDPEFLDSLNLFLELKGYTVYTADNPVNAKRLLADKLIHLAVIDVRLIDDRDEDDWSGLHLAAEAAPAVPKIILTGRRYKNPAELVLRVLRPDKRGHVLASDFVFKKEGPEKLLEAIRGVFQSKVRVNFDLKISWGKGLSWRTLVEMIKTYKEKSDEEKKEAGRELEDLVRRLFERASTLKMMTITPGHGGCGIVLARPSYNGVGGEDVVIKFGPTDTVITEYEKYRNWVEPFAATRSTQLKGEPARTAHLGAIKYSFIGEGPLGLVSFNDYYVRKSTPIKSIEETLHYLFEVSCGRWYQGKREPVDDEKKPLDAWYKDQLGFNMLRKQDELRDVLSQLLESRQAISRYFQVKEPETLIIKLGRGPLILPEPVYWILSGEGSAKKDDFFLTPSLLAITHGDLNGANILVDGEGKTWLIDFFKTGWGPILRDFTELESVIKFELIKTDSLLARHELEKALLQPYSLAQPIEFKNRSGLSELRKAVTVIQRLRELARVLADSEDIYEYYVGLFFYALKSIVGFSSKVGVEDPYAVSQYHALLSAAMICQRLQELRRANDQESSQSSRRSDVFLSYHRTDQEAVEYLAQRLREAELQVWLDRWNLLSGDPWQEEIEEALDSCATCVIFWGPSGLGPWQHMEMRIALERRVREKGYRVFPVLLPECLDPKKMSPFLRQMMWVDFRERLNDSEAFKNLVAGIRGMVPGPDSDSV